jgi:putative ABC transport system permease protein
LKEGGQKSASNIRRNRALSLLVVSEVALALVVLIGAGLLMKSFLRLQRVDPGIKPEQVLTLELNLPSAKYSRADWKEQRLAFYQQLIERIEAIPGVESAGAVDSLPLGGGGRVWRLRKEGSTAEGLAAGFQVVTTNYFRAMGIVLRGCAAHARNRRADGARRPSA